MAAEHIFPPHYGVQLTTWRHKLTDASKPKNNRRTSSILPYVILITGAGKGIGRHVALAYAQAGATGLVVTSRTQSDLDGLSKELLAINPNLDILAKATDTSDEQTVVELAKETSSRFHGHLDVAIAFAGIAPGLVPCEDDSGLFRIPIGLEDRDFKSVMDVNVTGTWYIAQHFVPLLLKNPSPDSPKAFIAASSSSANAADSSTTPVSYNISRLATVRMCELLHHDYHEKTGLQTFAIAPGHVLTSMTAALDILWNRELWVDLLNDDIDLCGGFLTWLTKERREWLSGRFLNDNYDVEELEKLRNEVVKEDKLKFRQIV